MNRVFAKIFLVMSAVSIMTLCSLMSVAAAGIDYNIAPYEGDSINYGENTFCRVTQYVLDGDVAKNQKIPYSAFDDKSANRDNEYTKLVNTTIGISEMPLFAVTKTTSNPSGSNVALCYFHPDKDDAGNAGADAFLQYIKMPSDLESPKVQLTFNFIDNNNLAKNVAPYNGKIYYMERGHRVWTETKISAYWFTLPKGFDGYIKIETAPLRAQGLNMENYSKSWRIYNYNMNVANLKRQTVIVSAPFKIEGNGNIQNAAYIGKETKVARNIFTGTPLTLKDITNHNCKYTSWETVKKATCSQEGSEKSTCTICALVEIRKTNKIEHNFQGTRIIKHPTCIETGVSEMTCADCGETKTVSINKTDHVTENFKIIEEATCTKNGLVCAKCKVCGEEFDKTVVKKEHNYGDFIVVKYATESEEGLSVKVCAACGNRLEETISKLSEQTKTEQQITDNSVTKNKTDKTALIIGIIFGVTATVLLGTVIVVVILTKKKS